MSRHTTGREFRRPAMPRGDVARNEEGKLVSRTTEEAKRIFLETLAATGSVVAGAAAADRSKWTVYQWAERDPAFAARWDKALTRGLGVIEKEAFRRAVEGSEEPLMSGGKVVGTVRRYSDHLLGLLMRLNATDRGAAPRPPEGDGPPVQFTFTLQKPWEEREEREKQEESGDAIEGGTIEGGGVEGGGVPTRSLPFRN
jgi:hypothetical protein